MTAEDIINNRANIFECALAFRQDANNLMRELSRDFNFSLESGEEFPRDVYDHKYVNKGLFRNDWTYYFHGAECRFENLKTGQVVELIHVTKPEFGFLDSYFLYTYMSTTDRFKNLAHWFINYSNVRIALETLADKGILTRITTVSIERNILAL